MASVCSPRRQLAPTVGPAAALAGVHIRAGILTVSGERVVSGLVQRLGSLDFVNDNAGGFAGGFAGGGRFPKNGRIIEFSFAPRLPWHRAGAPVPIAGAGGWHGWRRQGSSGGRRWTNKVHAHGQATDRA